MDRAALAGFLRRRREALQPGDVGLPAGSRRRAPGLRREEVAALAAMSADYYTRLEQQRGPQPSPIELDCQALFTEDQSQALLVLTAPPRTEGYEKLQLLAVLGQQRFAEARSVS